MKKELLVLFTILLSAFSPSLHAASISEGDERTIDTRIATAAEAMWEFYNTNDIKDGQTNLYDEFLNRYVSKEEVVPGDPQRRTVIKKPGIYNAVLSIRKHLRREVKNNVITDSQASAKLDNVLLIALSALNTSESISFEDALNENRSGAEGLLALFSRVKLKSLY